MKSLHARTFRLIAFVVLLNFIVFTLAFTVISYNGVVREKRATMTATARTAADIASAVQNEEGLESWSVRLLMSTLSRATSTRIVLADSGGTVVSSSDITEGGSFIGMKVPENALSKLRRDGEYSAFTEFFGGSSAKSYVVASCIKEPFSEKTLGFVFVESETGTVRQVWKLFFMLFVLAGGGVLLIALGMSLMLSKRQTEPMHRMAEAAGRFSKGDFSQRISEDASVSEIYELTTAFNSMADSLEQAEQKRRDFIANVSHELRTPMTTISGFADGILDGTVPREREEEYLRIISDESRRLARMVQKMLELSRLEEMDKTELLKKSFELTETVGTTLLSQEGRINAKHIEIEAVLPEEPVYVVGDEDAIRQVFYNLLDNAVKFSPEGGTVAVNVFKKDEKAYVSVRNSGETIPPEELGRIFDRFHKADRSRSLDREGAGFGLFIVKTIIENHGETVSVVSRDGVTEFTFSMTIRQ